MDDALLTLLVAVLGGGGLTGLLTFLATRLDAHKMGNREVLDAIERIRERLDGVEAKLDRQGEKADERDAVACRVRILHFYDELRSGLRHTKDSWDQCLSDITTYDRYCEGHPDFKNNQTELTVRYINEEYAERLQKNDFE